MILKNKRTGEQKELTYNEFRHEFAKDIQTSFESYRKTKLNKYSWHFKDDSSLEFNFYFDIRFNFNSFGNSAWYIEKLQRVWEDHSFFYLGCAGMIMSVFLYSTPLSAGANKVIPHPNPLLLFRRGKDFIKSFDLINVRWCNVNRQYSKK